MHVFHGSHVCRVCHVYMCVFAYMCQYVCNYVRLCMYFLYVHMHPCILYVCVLLWHVYAYVMTD